MKCFICGREIKPGKIAAHINTHSNEEYISAVMQESDKCQLWKLDRI
jgi:hypothetical protein